MKHPQASLALPGLDRDRLAAVAAAIARLSRPGDVIILSGPLAAGKTTFVQALAAALGSADAVTSPTFSLAHFYRSARLPLLHIDAYRLQSNAEFTDLGLDDFYADHLTAVEWGEAFRSVLPPALDIRLEPETETTRSLTLTSTAAAWQDRLCELPASLKCVRAQC
jgi:tRNA threonylcarbamoyladenosine biosynthesis protein TsaE